MNQLDRPWRSWNTSVSPIKSISKQEGGQRRPARVQQPPPTNEPAIPESESSPCLCFFGHKNQCKSKEMNHFIGEKKKAAVIWVIRTTVNNENIAEPRSCYGLPRRWQEPLVRWSVVWWCVYLLTTGTISFKPSTFSLLCLLMTKEFPNSWFNGILTSPQQRPCELVAAIQ